MEHKKIIGSYIRKGVLVGLIFPVLAIIICLTFLVPDDYGFSLIQIHRDFPLLWIIDSAPVVLALISYIVGTQASKSNTKFLSEIKDSNERLQTLNAEKEVLLKEIHHRVKNNLQIITSLLSLQASFIDDERSKALFRYSQYRINSMAMIHEMLYSSEDITKIHYADYAEKLIGALIASMKGSDHQITVDVDVPNIDLNIDTSIPLGLLINEIVTNALKYGVVGNERGVIHLHIKKGLDNSYIMDIGDNGAGFPENTNFRNSNSLGLMLIHKLTLQLKGNIEKDNQRKGTNYTVSFQEIDQNS